MDFDFGPEQYMFQESVRNFLGERFDHTKPRILSERDGIDTQLWQGLSELGAFSMLVPEDHGGLGLTLVDLALIVEEFGRALVPPPAAETIAAADLLVRYGTAEQKSRFLPDLAQGEITFAPALSELDAGFDPASIALTALSSRNGWSVSGSKIMVPYARQADFLLVALRLDAGGPLVFAAIEPTRAGVSLRLHANIDITSQFYEVTFSDTPIVRDDIVAGEPADGSVQRFFDVGGMIAATQMTGIAAKMLDASVTYARQRTQFGSLIGSFQAIKHRCADMAVSIDASRSAAYYAAWALANESDDAAKAVSMAKSYCGDSARFVCNEAIQIHGGIGFTWELGLHLYLRRAKLLEYTFGDASYHRERVISATLAQLASEE